MTPQAHSPDASPPTHSASPDPRLDAARRALRAAGGVEVIGHRELAPGVHTYRAKLRAGEGSVRVLVVDVQEGGDGRFLVRIIRRSESRKIGMQHRSPEPLTERQSQILGLLIDGLSRQDVPTHRDLMRALGLTGTHGMHEHLSALQRKGYVRRAAKRSHRMQVLRWPDGRPLMVSLGETDATDATDATGGAA